MTDTHLLTRFHQIQKRMDKACIEAGRSVHEVKLLAVSKGQSKEAIAQLYQDGQRDFGENYVGEMLVKQQQLLVDCPAIRWHFIGQIQTNKAEKIVRHSYMVQSVSTLRHGSALAKYHQDADPLRVLLQVNLDSQTHRGGIDVAHLDELFESISRLTTLRILGLMAVLPLAPSLSPGDWFAQVRFLRDRLEGRFKTQLPVLSMGMSEDFEEAIAHGATWVRLGTVLFGPRKKC